MARQRGLRSAPAVGTRVRLTGYFLRATGQVASAEGRKRFEVLPAGACGFPAPCGCGASCVAVDEAIDDAARAAMYGDVVSSRADGRLMRHIALANLEVVGAPPRAADQGDDVGPVRGLR